MTLHGTCNLNAEDETAAELLKAIGHPVRLRMVRELTSRNEQCCGEMCSCFELSQSTVSQHLAVLKDAGIVTVTKQGTRSCYSIEAGALRHLGELMQSLAKSAEAGDND